MPRPEHRQPLRTEREQARRGDSGGFLSRHSFGIAVDVNISRNSFGGRVEMDSRIVDIFRRWGFAWGGTWVRPDGMHLEWAP